MTPTALMKNIRMAWKLAQVRLFGQRIPVVIGWDITNRCNLLCAYCRQPNVIEEELDAPTAVRVASEMIRAGVEVVTLSGGEPMTRADLGEVASELKRGGAYLSLNTNGTLIEARRDVVRLFDHVKISLDGLEEVHDAIRGPGAFASAMKGLEVLKTMGKRVSIGVVLSAVNAGRIEELLQWVADNDLRLLVQPVTNAYAKKEEIAHLVPPPEAYRTTMDRIILEKNLSDRVVGSLPALRYLRSFPDSPTLDCYGGRGIGRICADGTLVPCISMRHRFRGASVREMPFAEAFASIPPSGCRSCYCSSTLDFNLLMTPRLGVFSSFYRRIR